MSPKKRHSKKQRPTLQSWRLEIDQIVRETEAEHPFSDFLPEKVERVASSGSKERIKNEFSEPEPDIGAKLVARSLAAGERVAMRDAADALRYNPNKALSQAAIDQGHGPVKREELARIRGALVPRPPFIPKPVRGKLRGESESDTVGVFESIPTGQDVQVEQLALDGLEESIARHPASHRIDT